MKRTIIVLLAALALLAAILMKKNSNEKSMRQDAHALDSARKADAAYLTVIKRQDTTAGKAPDTSALRLLDGKWVVARDSFTADTAKVNKVLGHIFRLQNKELVSNNAARLGEYGLDSVEAKLVAIRDGSGKSLAEVMVGKTSGADYSSTYWKWADKPEVYRTPGNFTWEIAVKEEEWKERKLFPSVAAKEIKFIESTWKDSLGADYSYKLESTSDSTWKMLAPQDSNRVKNSLAVDMANRFADMAIDEFIAAQDTNAAKINPDSAAIGIKVGMKDGTNFELKASRVLDGYAYARHPSRNDLVKVSGWRLDSFKKKPFELLDAPPAAPADTAEAAVNAPSSAAGSVTPTNSN